MSGSYGQEDRETELAYLRGYSDEDLVAEMKRRSEERKKPKPDIVEYPLYLHGTKEQARDAAEQAGFSDEEIEEFSLVYAGYEVAIKIRVDRSKKKFEEVGLWPRQ